MGNSDVFLPKALPLSLSRGPQLCHFLQNKGFTGKPFPFLGSACCNPPSRAAVTGCRAPISTQHCLTIPKPRICLLCVPGNSGQGCQGCQKWHRSHRSQQPNSRAVISPAAATTLTFASQTQETFQHAPSPHSSIPSTQAAPAAEWECTGTESPVRFVFQDVAVCSWGQCCRGHRAGSALAGRRALAVCWVLCKHCPGAFPAPGSATGTSCHTNAFSSAQPGRGLGQMPKIFSFLYFDYSIFLFDYNNLYL